MQMKAGLASRASCVASAQDGGGSRGMTRKQRADHVWVRMLTEGPTSGVFKPEMWSESCLWLQC